MYGPQGEFITSIRTPSDPQCMKAARACYNWKAWYYAPANSQCYIVEDDGRAIIDYVRYPDYDVYYGYPGSPYTRVPRTPPTTTRPEPTPEPTPTQTPTPTSPTPSPESDAIRAIEAGETVIFNSTFHMVVSVENTNFYNLKPMTGRERDREIVKDVARQYVAVTRGCHAGFCANDSVIVISSSSYAAVAGIEYDGQLITKSISRPEVMNFDVNPTALAWTKGCSPEGNGKVCVGNVVLKGRGLYYTVVGIQLDGKVVIENNDGPKKLTVNVNPISLLIVNHR
jgi:hypothetical protein